MKKTIFTLILCYTAFPAYSQTKVVANYIDTNNNGLIDTDEFVFQANEDLDKIIRMNSDGYLMGDSATIVGDMVGYVKSIFGDIDGDGVISITDMVSQCANLGATTPIAPKVLQGDMNQDGVVNGDDILLLFESQGTAVPVEESYAMALWAQIVSMASDVGYEPTLAEVFLNSSAQSNRRGPSDHNQAISATWPPHLPVTYPPQDWGWPGNHLGTVSSTWSTGGSVDGWPSNHLSVISGTWGDSSPGYWPPNHDVSRSATWNDDGMHQSLTSSTWPAGHLRAPSILGDGENTAHIAVVSSQNGDHNETISADAGWPPNHIQQVSRTWDASHNALTSAAWPSNHIMSISNSWPNPNPGWPPNHFCVISATWNQPGDHGTRISIIHQIPGLSSVPADLISLLELN